MTDSNQIFIRILRRRDLESRLRLSRSTIYDRINPDSPRYDLTFPKPIHLGGGTAVGWIESEVEAWLQQQVITSRKLG
jgi:prophage regulatory protein